MHVQASGTGRLRRLGLAFSTIALLGLGAVSACSSSGNDGASSAAADSTASGSAASACTQKADAYMKSWETLPTSLPTAYAPLATRPKPNGYVIYVGDGVNPEDADTGTAVGQAAKAIGWRFSFFSDDGSVPDTDAKLQEAVQAHPTAIILTGTPPAAIEVPLKAAAAAGIPVTVGAVPAVPTSTVGFANTVNSVGSFQLDANIMANWVMSDSGCKGDAVLFGLPYPILTANGDQFVKEMKSLCRSCSATYTQLPVADVGTPAGTQAIVSAVQANPSIKYIGVNVGVMATGLAQALEQAGITGTKIFGISPDINGIKGLQEGTNSMWIDKTTQMLGWVCMDGTLRGLESGKPFTGLQYPEAVLTTSNVSKSATSVLTYPLNYETAFEKLWHVG